MKIYEKYRENGAIHWKEYEDNPQYRDWVDYIISLFPSSGSVLDVGCGDGLWSAKLADRGLNVMGIDSSEHGIERAREKRKDLEFRVCEAEIMADWLVNKPFDYCLATEIIEHLSDPKAMVRIFEYHIKHFMILTTPNRDLDERHSPNHYMEHTEKEIRELFSGYKVSFIKNTGLHGKWSEEKTIIAVIKK